MQNRIKKSLFVVYAFVLSVSMLHSQTVFNDTIFFDDFGQHTTRVPCPYMPAGSYTFADPTSTATDDVVINDNHYAVIDPRHIADENPPFYFWTSTSPYSLTPTGARPYTTDHTGNTNGAVMVVNAGITLNYLYKRTVTLKTGHLYRFSFWIYVVNKSSQFAMDATNTTTNTRYHSSPGALLDQEGSWIPYSIDFPVRISATDSTNNVIVDLQNTHAQINGNDYYIDDILLRTFQTTPLKDSIGSNSPVCEGAPITLFANTKGGAQGFPFAFLWKGPDGFTSTQQFPVLDKASLSMAGKYFVNVTDTLGHSVNDSVNVQVLPPPASDFMMSKNTIDSRNNTVTFTVNPKYGVHYQWNFGDGTMDSVSFSPTHTYIINGDTAKYVVMLKSIIDSTGCTNTSSQTIEVTPFVPNVFTPNGDGINDVFMANFDLQIFDRFGILMYQGDQGWDGTYKGHDADPDTYFYVLHFMDANKHQQTKKGYVMLLR